MEQKNKSNNNIEWCIHQGILANQGIHWCEKQLKDYPECCGKHCPYYEAIVSFYASSVSVNDFTEVAREKEYRPINNSDDYTSSPEVPKERRTGLKETKSYE